MPTEVADGDSKKTVTYKVVTLSSRTGDIPTDLLGSSTVKVQSFEDLAQEMHLKEENKQKIYTLGKSYDTVTFKIDWTLETWLYLGALVNINNVTCPKLPAPLCK